MRTKRNIQATGQVTPAKKELKTPDPALSIPVRPNIKFAGRKLWDKGKTKVLYEPQPIERFSEGTDVVILPDPDFQKRNRLFYHEAARRIVRLFPHLYKLVKPKGV